MSRIPTTNWYNDNALSPAMECSIETPSGNILGWDTIMGQSCLVVAYLGTTSANACITTESHWDIAKRMRTAEFDSEWIVEFIAFPLRLDFPLTLRLYFAARPATTSHRVRNLRDRRRLQVIPSIQATLQKRRLRRRERRKAITVAVETGTNLNLGGRNSGRTIPQWGIRFGLEGFEVMDLVPMPTPI